MTSLELAKETVKILDEKKAMDLKVIGIKDISVIADYFVFSTGTSSTHVKSLAEEVEFKLKQLGVSPEHVDGYRSNSWVLLDYGNVMVHIFTADAREFYNLDRLWQDAEKIDISDIVKE
ncbi:ribosome silencing factor [Caproiciproducens sp. CPB-2]|uniref:ribosome silencing factor n=1 Tax=Caproiciproducens sp. CPB-2 TaxID=3030017 RepID=UPI0023DC8B13|nr:ribosome silencing factor [Caproiciproducens sp. CPB-2]MDF1495923.1 ribosome silencing factor [Caproiciproducens sp. CPB-2]